MSRKWVIETAHAGLSARKLESEWWKHEAGNGWEDESWDIFIKRLQRYVQQTLWNVRNFKKLCTASDLAAVDAPGVIVCIREAIASFRENSIISAWAYTVVRSSGHGNSHGLGVWNGQHAVYAFFVSLLPLIGKDWKLIWTCCLIPISKEVAIHLLTLD